jgi:hypothetical protein
LATVALNVLMLSCILVAVAAGIVAHEVVYFTMIDLNFKLHCGGIESAPTRANDPIVVAMVNENHLSSILAAHPSYVYVCTPPVVHVLLCAASVLD